MRKRINQNVSQKTSRDRKITQVLNGSFLLFFLLAGYILFIPCKYNMNKQTYFGKTAMGSLIALEFTIDEGKVLGEGCHRFSRGKKNYVNFSGFYDCDTNSLYIEQEKVGTQRKFGTLNARIDLNSSTIIGYWLNPNDMDRTNIELEQTNFDVEEILASNQIPQTRNRPLIQRFRNALINF